jgi:hypothetical protein
MIIAVAIKSSTTETESFVHDIECAAADTKWTISKGIDGVTIILGLVASSAVAAISKTFIKYLERKDSIIVELTIDKRKYKFKGMDKDSVLAIVQSIGVKHDGN